MLICVFRKFSFTASYKVSGKVKSGYTANRKSYHLIFHCRILLVQGVAIVRPVLV